MKYLLVLLILIPISANAQWVQMPRATFVPMQVPTYQPVPVYNPPAYIPIQSAPIYVPPRPMPVYNNSATHIGCMRNGSGGYSCLSN
jgi:hypothetical protein